jgi:hypothetical protein
MLMYPVGDAKTPVPADSALNTSGDAKTPISRHRQQSVTPKHLYLKKYIVSK